MKNLLLLAFVLILSGAVVPSTMADRKSHGEGINIRHAWVRPTPPGMTMTAGYLRIYNDGTKADRLIGISSSAAKAVEIHEVVKKDGMMHMQPVKGGLFLPAGGIAVLKPGGYHLMLIGLKKPVKAGARLELKLTFEHAPTVLVVAIAADSDDSSSHHRMDGGSMGPKHKMN